MAERISRNVRLRDQVYDLICEDLRAGTLAQGQRAVEADIASRYNVSRTPVREALFQLWRDGILIESADRGYEVPIDTQERARHRHEVRRLIDPALGEHAARDGTADQRKQLAKALERQRTAHAAGKLLAFGDANLEFRGILREMCANETLRRCSSLVDAQSLSARRESFRDPARRLQELELSEQMLKAIGVGDAEAAGAAMLAYVGMLRDWSKTLPG